MRGFTLFEMMVTLSLAIIICFLALPSFRQYLSQTSDTITQTQLLQQLQRAQQVANANLTSVVVCMSDDGKTCVANNGDMVLIFADSNSDGVLHNDNQLITSVFLKGHGTLHLRSYPAYRNYLLFLPTVAAKSDNGTFWYCSKDHTLQWAVAVSQFGEPRAVNPNTLEEQLVC